MLGIGGQCEVVGEEDEAFLDLGGVVTDAPQGRRVELAGFGSGQHYGLIAAHTGALVDGMRVAAAELQVALGANDKEGGGLLKTIQARKVELAAIHDEVGTDLVDELIEHRDVVDLAVSNVEKCWNRARILSSVWSLMATLVRRKCGQGKSARRRSMVLASKA